VRAEHQRDQKHGKGGFVGANVRYSRKKPARKMGKARASTWMKP
jgi:hypothetical protein